MATATILIKDLPGGKVEVVIEFSDRTLIEQSRAYQMALEMATSYLKRKEVKNGN